MAKLLLTALLSVASTWVVLELVQPASAAEPGQWSGPSIDVPAMPPVLSWPAPQAPYETTPITPYETVGAAHHEPF